MTLKQYFIKQEEKQIIGNWIAFGKQDVGDDACQRIEWLIENHLVFVSHDKSGWNTLYKDPADNRLWERIYLQSEMHGGGPPSLLLVNKKRLEEGYGASL
ncbi:MAG: hypothetical protein COA91_05145 [Robiginitomaculum sp.]|nr:MAG: hypothetical protein COA91_05145 [Robiginitomaculum sp.]